MRNAVLIALALAVLAGGFVLARDTGDSDDPAPATQAATSAAPPTAPADTAPAATAETTPAPPPKPAVPTIVVEDGKPQGGVKEREFDKGDRARFRVRADAADEIHVHGYDRYVDLEPGKTATIAFEAEFDGRFEVELHGNGQQLAELRIQP